MAALAASQLAKREAARTKHRQDFPFAAELMDMFAEFDPKLIYAEQGDKTIGRKPDESQNMDAMRFVEMIEANTRTVAAMNPRKRT